MTAIIDRLAGADRAPTAVEMFSTITEEDKQALLMFPEKITGGIDIINKNINN